MAKRQVRRKQRNSAFQALKVNAILTLGALGLETAITQALTVLADDFWVQSADLAWTIRLLTSLEGPVALGLANGDLSVAEIKEAINASPVSRSDIIAREQARRPIREVGQVSADSDGGVLQLNDGQPVRTSVKMYLAEGTELNAFAFNQTGVALTTGAIVRIWGTLYGTWK